MNDQPASTQPSSTYVDDYTPPTPTRDNTFVAPIDGEPVITVIDPSNMNVSSNDDAPLVTINPSNVDVSSDDQNIEDQNIFIMLGVEDGTDDLKENFLDELQNVIWDDFLENDVTLLITSDETPKYKELLESKNTTSDESSKETAQDKLVEYLESLIPDLEDIMLEKALDLKADLFAERISGMKEYFADKPEELKKVGEAEQMMFDDNWKSSAVLLNSIKE